MFLNDSVEEYICTNDTCIIMRSTILSRNALIIYNVSYQKNSFMRKLNFVSDPDQPAGFFKV
jgi:hypothetical protein